MNAQFYIEGKYKFEHTSNRKIQSKFSQMYCAQKNEG